MRADAGFTLFELLVTISVAAILLAIGTPLFRQTLADNRATVHVNDLVGALNLARGTAVSQARNIALCPSSDGASCRQDGAIWSNGWLVYVPEPDGSGAAADNILRIQQFDDAANRIVSTRDDPLVFNSSGFALLPRRFQIGPTDGPAGATICVAATGTVRTASGDTTSCS